MHRPILSEKEASASSHKVPTPRHRHAAPSAPWPFVDIDDDFNLGHTQDPDSSVSLFTSTCDHQELSDQENCWCEYPQSLYPNWTPRQQRKANLLNLTDHYSDLCIIHRLDVMNDASFIDVGKLFIDNCTVEEHWKEMQKERSANVHVRALFVGGLTGNAMRVLGTRYNLEPFFFSSTMGWIPSRHQTNLVPYESDHITITLTFVRPISTPVNDIMEDNGSMTIDTRSPLLLPSRNIALLADQFALHMVRSRNRNTIISLHPSTHSHATSARTLHSRVQAAGRSVYWNNIFKGTEDPTFVLICLLWYPLYSWDEALEHLYNHVCFLETQVMQTNDMQLSHELHVIRAHLLHFETLLEDFTKTVEFVRHTRNPGLQRRPDELEDLEEVNARLQASETMERECGNMLTEIHRLEQSRDMVDKRVKNVMDLTFSMANIEDSKRVQKLTEASMKDSAAIKQISYLTMAFAPAGFVAAVFGMNVNEIAPGSIPTLGRYIAAAIPLTVLTVWIIVAYQIQIPDPSVEDNTDGVRFDEGGLLGTNTKFRPGFKQLDVWQRIWWPAVLLSTLLERKRIRNERRKPQTRITTDSLQDFTI